MSRVFVDTGAWFARFVPNDPDHAAAKAWLEANSTYRDKGWSFTDCVSRAVMARLEISAAFAFDDHFRQFGSVVVQP